MKLLAAFGLALLGCGQRVDCAAAPADTVLATVDGDALTCRDVVDVVDHVQTLAGRALVAGDTALVQRRLVGGWEKDSKTLAAELVDLRAVDERLGDERGIDAAEARSEAVWVARTQASEGAGLYGRLGALVTKNLGVWEWSDEQRLALTESDMEAWIRYASLCREAQGGGTLRVSVADRVAVYRVLRARFREATRAERIALAAFGPFWSEIHSRWMGASYDLQQQWVQTAPFPPPMTGTSIDYFEALINGDVVGHVQAMHNAVGAMTL